MLKETSPFRHLRIISISFLIDLRLKSHKKILRWKLKSRTQKFEIKWVRRERNVNLKLNRLPRHRKISRRRKEKQQEGSIVKRDKKIIKMQSEKKKKMGKRKAYDSPPPPTYKLALKLKEKRKKERKKNSLEARLFFYDATMKLNIVALCAMLLRPAWWCGNKTIPFRHLNNPCEQGDNSSHPWTFLAKQKKSFRIFFIGAKHHPRLAKRQQSAELPIKVEKQRMRISLMSESRLQTETNVRITHGQTRDRSSPPRAAKLIHARARRKKTHKNETFQVVFNVNLVLFVSFGADCRKMNEWNEMKSASE
jgi:hypothetical protein